MEAINPISVEQYKSQIDNTSIETARIKSLRQKYYSSDVHICADRSNLATKSWMETEGQPLHIRRAKLFARICDEIPIAIFDQELIVGSQTHYLRGVGLQLDFNPLVALEINQGDRRVRAEQTKGIINDNDLNQIREDSKYWLGKSPGEVMLKTIRDIMGPDFDDLSESCSKAYCFYTNYSPDADYELILQYGLKNIISRINKEIAAINYTTPHDGQKYLFLEAAKICLEAEIRLAKRYAKLARSMAETEVDENRKNELSSIADNCENVPENPPKNFWQALQSIRLIHLGLYFEDGNGNGASLCRMDQYLYPWYRQDIDGNILTREQAGELLAAFWVKIAATDRIPPSYLKISGYVQSRIILGGVDIKGNDASNELTYLILHTAGQLKMNVPMYLRWNPQMKQEVMIKAVLTNMHTGSEPAFHNDKQIIPGLVADGAMIEDARDYIIHGCSEPFPRGGTYGSIHMINGAKALELVLYNGYDPSLKKHLGLKSGDPCSFATIDNWIEAFMKQCEYMFNIIIKGYNIGETVQIQVYSQPFASALKPGCITTGKDVHEGGSLYQQFTGDVMTKIYADIADSLIVINELIYKQHKISAHDLIEACSNNFVGEKGEQILKMIDSVPKYGNDLGDPENIYRILNDRVTSMVNSKTGYFGFPKRDARLGGAVHIAHGRVVGALPNGRKAEMPLSDGSISPCAGCDVRGPTVTIKSVSKAIDFNTNRAAIFNQKIPKSLLSNNNEINQMVNLIETFFDHYNGYQIQWNIQDNEIYIAAKSKPAEYKNLLVRVGGYSAYFIEIDPALQDQIIKRTQQQFNC